MCVFVCALRRYPANPAWGSWCVCLGLRFGFHLANPGWGVGVCVFVCAFRLHPANPGWDVWCACVCLGCILAAPRHSWLRCWGASVCLHTLFVPRQTWLGIMVLVFWVWFWGPPCQCWLGCWHVCVCVCTSPAPCNSLLGCVVWVCVLLFEFRLRPAIPGWGLGVCVCVRAPLVPRHSSLGFMVCAWVWVVAFPQLILVGCRDVFVCVRAPPAPRQSLLGCAVQVCVFGLWFRVRPAILGWGVWVCLVLCALCLHLASPAGVCRACVSVWVLAFTPPIQAGPLGRVCLCARSACTPPVLAGCSGHVEAVREHSSWYLPLIPAEAGALGSLSVVPVRDLVMG